MSQMLVLVGAITAAIFYVVLIVEGALRPGYHPVYHTGSELSLGERGWIQIANFIQFGIGMICFAVGTGRLLNSLLGTALLAVFGLALIGAGVFRTDPIRGYPPGTPRPPTEEISWHHRVHGAMGPIAFLAVFGACLSVADRLDGVWQVYTLVTGVIGLALVAWTDISIQRDASIAGLVQRCLILVYVVWVILLSTHLL